MSSSHCSWFGVSCSINGTRVQALRLPDLGLIGLLPPQLSNFSSLRILNLFNNSFYGPIPPEFGQLSDLETIILAGNSINGTVPVGLSDCYNLVNINLENNDITGYLPSELGSLQNLKILDVSANTLTGAIPRSFGNLSSLTNLSLAKNQLSDAIPNELGSLSNLLMLQLSENQLSGEIPLGIYNISSLVYLSLTENKLRGYLFTDMGIAFPNLQELYLSHNSLEGPIPSSLSELSEIRKLDLSTNSFQGSVPLFGKMNNLVTLRLGDNNLSSTTKLNSQVFDSLKNCTKLVILIMNSNRLTGELPSSLANLSASLSEFCFDNNFLTGSFPQGLENYLNLTAFVIHNNSFTGKIPDSIGKLHRLEIFLIHGNMLSGEIPDVFGNLKGLYSLTMGDNQFFGRIPPSLAECSQLSELGLAWNRLNGSIPEKIFRLPNLISLRLARNSLSGSLPTEIGSLHHLGNLDLSENQLTGNIPITTGDCSGLLNLNLASNNFSGSIPNTIGKLASLKSMNLASNKFSGIIPAELENIHSLLDLNLSFNQLEGEVPRRGVFVNLTWDSLQGNYKLCGTDEKAVAKLRLAECVTKKKTSSHVLLKIAISVSCSIVLVCVMFCIIWALIMHKKKQRRSKRTVSFSTYKGSLPQISYSKIRLATNGFDSENLIGRGAFGSVYKAVFDTGESGIGTTLAVKVLDLKQSKALKSFDAECEALRNVRHRNLVKVITSCSSIDHLGGEFKALVMEFMSNGSLDSWLYPKESASNLTLTQRLNIAIDIASAMDYLHHDCEPPMVHCDLKPGNVLLDDDMNAHVGDFGLARFASQNSSENANSTIALKGSIGYIAPEYGLGSKPSTEGDVYSFGILLLEIFIAKRPTDEMFKEGSSLNKFAAAVHENRVSEIADPRVFIHSNYSTQSTATSYYNQSSNSDSKSSDSNWQNKTEECVVAVIKLALNCAAHSETDRLSMRVTLTKLNEIKKILLGL